MKRQIFFTATLAAALAFGVGGCTEPLEERGNPTPLGSIELDVAGVRTRLVEADPTTGSVADRAEAGAELTVKIGSQSAPYIYSDGRWVPEGATVEFPGYGNSVVELTLSDPSGVQDGSAEGLLDADVLTWKAEMSPIRELSGIRLSHARTLIEIQVEGDLTIDEDTDVLVDDAVAYDIPDSDNRQAIVDAGGDGFNVTLTTGGVKYVIWTSRDQVTGGEFKAGFRYKLILTNVGMAVELRAVVLEPWGESGEGTARALMSGTIDLGDNYTAGTSVAVTYASGAVNTLEFDDPSEATKGSIWGIDGDVVKSIRVDDGPEILLGRAVGDEIVLALNADGSDVTLRRDNENRHIIGSIAELRKIDGPGMASGSFIQEADIHLMKMPWTPLFLFDDQTSNFFKGTFDGGGYKIHDILFAEGGGAFIKGNDGGTIKNVHIASGKIGGGRGFINLAGICTFNQSGTIENCTNEATIEGSSWTAGICVINQGTVRGCVNRGPIQSYGDGGFSNAGGIVGINGDAGQANASAALVENCTNYGLVYGLAYTNGGIASSNFLGTIRNCTNNGEVRGDIFVAGIAATNWNLIEDCTNNGVVTAADGTTGGIVSIAYSDVAGGGSGEVASRIVGCVNNGTITSSSIGATGGILASANLNGDKTAVIDCTNNGAVNGGDSVGGIVGDNSRGEILACVNTGVVRATNTIAGGIAGENDNRIVACYNTSTNVYARDIVGGIAGANGGAASVSACWSTGTIGISAGRQNIGGIAGNNNATGKVLDCFWSGPAKGIGTDNNSAESIVAMFGETSWPTEDSAKNWGIGSDYAAGGFWSSLGGWDAENPVYPELNWKTND